MKFKKLLKICFLSLMLSVPTVNLIWNAANITAYARPPEEDKKNESTASSESVGSGDEKNPNNVEIQLEKSDIIKFSDFGDGTDAANQLKEFMTNDKKTGLYDIIQDIGAVLLAFALGKMILAFKDENPGEKAMAVTLIMGGVLLMSLPSILTTIDADLGSFF